MSTIDETKVPTQELPPAQPAGQSPGAEHGDQKGPGDAKSFSGLFEIAAMEPNTTDLPVGQYSFKVVAVATSQGDRRRTAILSMTLQLTDTAIGKSDEVNFELPLKQSESLRIAELFVSVGLADPRRPFKPDFSRLRGANGVCLVERGEVRNSMGNSFVSNHVSRFLRPKTEGSVPA